jgi:hypothetical protein
MPASAPIAKNFYWGVPQKMDETYTSKASDVIVCTATYSRYRRFNVSTDEVMKKPPQ